MLSGKSCLLPRGQGGVTVNSSGARVLVPLSDGWFKANFYLT